jgi:hypothetical protein
MGLKGQLHVPSHFNLRKITPNAHRKGGWLGTGASLDAVGKRNILQLWESILDYPTFLLYRLGDPKMFSIKSISKIAAFSETLEVDHLRVQLLGLHKDMSTLSIPLQIYLFPSPTSAVRYSNTRI